MHRFEKLTAKISPDFSAQNKGSIWEKQPIAARQVHIVQVKTEFK